MKDIFGLGSHDTMVSEIESKTKESFRQTKEFCTVNCVQGVSRVVATRLVDS